MRTSLIQETIVKLEAENLPGLLLFADFEKAFDSINHELMFNCLKCFNFGSDIINLIKCFYNDAKSAVINSGHMTDFFDIKKRFKTRLSFISLSKYYMNRTAGCSCKRK